MQNVYDEAVKHNGLKEIRGAAHNPQIVQWFADVGHSWVQDDETAWCAAFVGAMLVAVGLPSTKKLNARSYMTWGYEVDLEDAEPGDVVVLWREDPSSWKGHVALIDSLSGDKVKLLGGNQRDAVSIAAHPVSKVLSVRRMASKPRHLGQSRTMQGLAASGVGAAMQEGADAVAGLVSDLPEDEGFLSVLKIIGIVLTIGGIGFAVYARWDDWEAGHR